MDDKTAAAYILIIFKCALRVRMKFLKHRKFARVETNELLESGVNVRNALACRPPTTIDFIGTFKLYLAEICSIDTTTAAGARENGEKHRQKLNKLNLYFSIIKQTNRQTQRGAP